MPDQFPGDLARILRSLNIASATSIFPMGARAQVLVPSVVPRDLADPERRFYDQLIGNLEPAGLCDRWMYLADLEKLVDVRYVATRTNLFKVFPRGPLLFKNGEVRHLVERTGIRPKEGEGVLVIRGKPLTIEVAASITSEITYSFGSCGARVSRWPVGRLGMGIRHAIVEVLDSALWQQGEPLLGRDSSGPNGRRIFHVSSIDPNFVGYFYTDRYPLANIVRRDEVQVEKLRRGVPNSE